MTGLATMAVLDEGAAGWGPPAAPAMAPGRRRTDSIRPMRAANAATTAQLGSAARRR